MMIYLYAGIAVFCLFLLASLPLLLLGQSYLWDGRVTKYIGTALEWMMDACSILFLMWLFIGSVTWVLYLIENPF